MIIRTAAGAGIQVLTSCPWFNGQLDVSGCHDLGQELKVASLQLLLQ